MRIVRRFLQDFVHTVQPQCNHSTRRNPQIILTSLCRGLKMSSTGLPDQLTVEHDEKKKEFFIAMNEGDAKSARALLQYEWTKDNTMDIHHTFVPPVFRGKGVAKLLAKKALDFGVDKDAKLVLSCSYVAKYVQDNPLPQYTSRV